MIAISWYILKVLIVSGILCGYYFLALKDKVFHKWNRFYLLFTVVLSLALPFISIDIATPAVAEQGTAIKVLQAVTIQDEAIIEMEQRSSFLTTNNLLVLGYLLISLVFIGVLLRTLLKIYRIKRNYPNTQVEGINFINTNDKSTPFSFFNSIFWNQTIDLHSSRGQQIFNHEVAHVKEKHTHDKVFMNVVLLFFWINPFFWIIRKELHMIHEFVADKMAVEDGDINAFAEMILSSVYPGEQFSMTNNFFYSPIKRRLRMLSKNTNSKVNYVSRLLALPLAAIVFFAFTLKMKKADDGSIYNGKQITVIIDAGHGGTDPGANEGNFNEKDLNLAIAQQVEKLNTNKNIQILLSRSTDQFINVRERVQFAKDNNADLFISIHMSSIFKKPGSEVSAGPIGLDILIPKDANPYFSESKLLASSITEVFKNNYPLPTLKEVWQSNTGPFILKENQYPAIVINPARINASTDLSFISKPENQELVARNILRGIENYAQNKYNIAENSFRVNDTIPAKKIASYQVIEKDNKVIITYTDKSKETLNKEEAQERGFVFPPIPPAPPKPGEAPNPLTPPPPTPPSISSMPEDALFILDGAPTNRQTIENLDPSSIYGVSVLKKETLSIYGEKGRNGVVIVTTKNVDNNDKDDIYSKDSSIKFRSTNTKNRPLFYVDGKIIKDVESIHANNIESINVYKGEEAIKKFGSDGEKGVVEIFMKKQDVPDVATKSDKIITQVENAAQFPGGAAKWSQYIQKVISDNISEFDDKDYGTCVVKFIVDENGKVSEVEATTMKGTALAKTAVDAIRKGPNWIPASQNGRKVNAYRLQPVTLTNPGNGNSQQALIAEHIEQSHKSKDPAKVFTKVQVEASFPGGAAKWAQYISQVITQNIKDFGDQDYGTCVVKFIVDENGKVSEVEATTMKGTALAKTAVDAIRKGPNWVPASQNGRKINAYRLQPVTLKKPAKEITSNFPEKN